MRAHYQRIVVADNQAMIDKYKLNPTKAFKFDLTNFLQKFPMYKGIQQFYLHEIKKEKKRAERR
jgi:hypothetical protein